MSHQCGIFYLWGLKADFRLKRRDPCIEGGKKSCNLFLSDTKLASRERAKLCFKAVRCKNSEGRFCPECSNFLKKILFGCCMLKLWVLMMLKQYLLFLSLENYTFADIVFGNEQVGELVQLHILSCASIPVKPLLKWEQCFHSWKVEFYTSKTIGLSKSAELLWECTAMLTFFANVFPSFSTLQSSSFDYFPVI